MTNQAKRVTIREYIDLQIADGHELTLDINVTRRGSAPLFSASLSSSAGGRRIDLSEEQAAVVLSYLVTPT